MKLAFILIFYLSYLIASDGEIY